MPRRARGWSVRVVLCSALGLFAGIAQAAVSEYELKAAFLYNFVAFTEWPATVQPGAVLCVFGNDPFGSSLDSLRGKAARSATLEVRRVQSLSEARKCHVLFISPAAGQGLDSILPGLRGAPVLTVAETPGAARQGAVIGLVTDQARVGFEINLNAAKGAGLSLSSKLLRLAKEVYSPP